MGVILPNLPFCKCLRYENINPPNPTQNQIPSINLLKPIIPEPLVEKASSDFPPQNVIKVPSEPLIIPAYNNINQGYNSVSGNIYDVSPVAPYAGYPQNIYGNIPPPPNYYPNPQ